ncbi:hypothetical protein GOAMR_45_00330 [Gordonia amarae NBRC 15530]|uniref:N-acetyltransferase domain-containing protein n=1 Tax=Gordonia amarae NBRC 15530 TaxID=1075090 RepID=G7GQG2_9ACTN|nr:hypothetical protein GOAMR_45_00330 [Gordonia amarae NBRC 15530]
MPATGQARNGVERVHCRALGPDDHSEAVGLVTQGVLELPIYRWLFGIKGHWDLLSERSARWTAELMCEWLRQGGGGIGAFDADNRLVGLILLTLPGQPVPTMTEDQVAYLTELVRADPDVGRRLVKMRGGGDADLSRADAIDVAHAVVDPRVRKSGILRKLAIAVNELALELARPLTLKTNVPGLAEAYRSSLFFVDTGSYVDASGATTWVFGQEVADMPQALARLRGRG